MNPLELFLFLTFLYYSYFYKLSLFIIYICLIVAYVIFSEGLMKPDRRINSFSKKRLISGYKGPSEGMIMVSQEIDVTNALPYVEELKLETGLKITITHLAIRALGLGFHQFPEIQGHMKFGNVVITQNQFDPSKKLGLSVVACVGEGADAIPYTFSDPHKQNVKQIAEFLNEKVKIARTISDKSHVKRLKQIKSVPPFMNQVLSYIFTYIINNIGWNLPCLNLKRRNYGQSVLTNVGVFGMKKGFSCLSPLSGFNFFVGMGAVHKKAKVINGKIQVRNVMTFNYSVDHRFGDGVSSVKFSRTVDQYFNNPKEYETKLKSLN